MARDLAAIGVPLADVLTDPSSSNTYLNAQFSRKSLESIRPDRNHTRHLGLSFADARVYHFGKVFSRRNRRARRPAQRGLVEFGRARANLDWLEVGLHELFRIYWYNLR